jgi:serine/threonine protein kinase
VHDGAPHIVFERLAGETLRERLAGGPLAPRSAVELAANVAEGLAAAHEKGIVHRDLKPENIFVTKEGRPKILDLGLAKLRPDLEQARGSELTTLSGITTPGVVVGTLAYMSPEQQRWGAGASSCTRRVPTALSPEPSTCRMPSCWRSPGPERWPSVSGSPRT